MEMARFPACCAVKPDDVRIIGVQCRCFFDSSIDIYFYSGAILMSTEPSTGPVTKRPLVSVPFLVTVGALAVVAYFAAPRIMPYVFLMTGNIGSGAAETTGQVTGQAGAENAESNSEGQTEGPGGGRGGRGPGGFDREAFFAERDADSNGKLEGEEISERMRERMTNADTDKDGAISKEEFMASPGGPRGQGGPGGDGGEQNRGGGRPPADDSESAQADAKASPEADAPAAK
jgi:hypothetical protein